MQLRVMRAAVIAAVGDQMTAIARPGDSPRCRLATLGGITVSKRLSSTPQVVQGCG